MSSTVTESAALRDLERLAGDLLGNLVTLRDAEFHARETLTTLQAEVRQYLDADHSSDQPFATYGLEHAVGSITDNAEGRIGSGLDAELAHRDAIELLKLIEFARQQAERVEASDG